MLGRSVTVAAALATALMLISCAPDEAATVVKPLAARLEEADQMMRGGRDQDAGALYESIAVDALAARDTSAFVQASAMRAATCLYADQFDAGREWLARAERSARPSLPAAWARYLAMRGRYEKHDGENERASETFRELFDFSQEHNLPDQAVDAAHMLALTTTGDERFDWARRGIEMAEGAGMVGQAAQLWNNLGWDYVDAGRYEDGLQALEKAREYHDRGTAEIPKLIADYSVAYVKRRLGDEEASTAEMQSVLERASALAEQGNPDAPEWVGFSRWELGEIAVDRGDTEAGIGLMRQALAELEAAGIARWDPDDWEKKKTRVEELGSR
jgi:tetratricopeptide (TPR) repeat protein